MAKAPTLKQRKRWEKIRERGCSVCGLFYAEVHHAFTGGGRRRNHDFVFGLCNFHHTGEQGIHKIGRKLWQETYGTESHHLDKVEEI